MGVDGFRKIKTLRHSIWIEFSKKNKDRIANSTKECVVQNFRKLSDDGLTNRNPG